MEQATTPDLGARLRQARLRQGSTLAHVGARIGVAPKHLRALEWERFDLLPDDRTARRALCAYAEELELDPEPYLSEYEARIGQPKAPADPPRERRVLGRSVAPFIVVFAPALAAVALIMLFDAVRGSDKAAEAQSSPRARQSPAVVAPPPPVTAPTASQPAAAASPLAPERRQARHAAVRPSRPIEPGVAKLVVAASRGDSWLVVRSGSAGGPILFTGILTRGRSFDVARPRLWIRIGAASNVDLRVNGSRPGIELFGTVDAVVGPAGLKQVPLTP